MENQNITNDTSKIEENDTELMNISKKEMKILNERNNLIKRVEKLKEKIKYDKDFINRNNKTISLKSDSFIYEKKYYKNLIFNECDDNTVKNLIPELEFCITTKQKDIWNFFRTNVSSIHTNDNVGKNVKILVKDKVTQKYLGILGLSSDLNSLGLRDEYIGWTNINKNYEKKKDYLINITCCVGLQPISHNLNIGKLLVSLCFSGEVQEYFKKKYGHYFAGVTTFGINGKSVQYDRIEKLKFLGYTKGNVPEIPEDLYKDMQKHMENIGVDIKIYNNCSHSKNKKIQRMLKELGFSTNILNHHIKRGIYFGFTCKRTSIQSKVGKTNICKDFLCSKSDYFIPELKNIQEISEEWKKKWAVKRYQHLKNIDSLKKEIELIKFDSSINNRIAVNAYNKKMREKLGEEKYKELHNKYFRQYYQDKKENPKLELIETYNNLNSIDFHPSYLGGLYDGDGCIRIQKIESGYQLVVGFYQSVTNILEYLQKAFGGFIYKINKNCGPNTRQQYAHKLYGKECEMLLNYLDKGCILKHDRVITAKKFLNHIKKENSEEKEKLYLKLSQLNQGKIVPNKNYDKINYEYIAGLFDSEGYIGCRQNGKIKLSICQKSHPDILEKIKIFLGYGTSNNTHFLMYNSANIKILLSKMYDFLIVKKYQVDHMFSFLETNKKLSTNKNSAENIEEKRRYHSEMMKQDKHTSINIENEKLKQNNNFHKNVNKNVNDDIKQIEKIKKNEEIRDIMSEKKKGINNCNYGIIRNEEHCNKISENTIGKHRSITDEQIDEMKKLRNEGLKYTEIAKKFNMSRQCVTDYINDKFMKISDINDENMKIRFGKMKKEKEQKRKEMEMIKNMTTEQIKIHNNRKNSLSKRSYGMDIVVDILELKLNKNTSTNVVKIINQKYNENKITIDIVKNIWSGKTKFDEIDFENQNMTYEKYKQIIKGNHETCSVQRGMAISSGSRTIPLNIMIYVLEQKDLGINYNQIHDDLKNMYPNDENITFDKVKKIGSGKLKIFENEFDNENINMTYEKYCQILNSKKKSNRDKISMNNVIYILKQRKSGVTYKCIYEEFKNIDNNEGITFDKIKKIGSGAKTFEKVDFDNTDMTYEEYLKIIAK